MADYPFAKPLDYLPKVNGADAAPSQSTTLGLDFWTVTTNVNILPLSASGTAASQQNLNALIELISVNGQPIIQGLPTNNSGTYTFTFAHEHPGAWLPSATAGAHGDWASVINANGAIPTVTHADNSTSQFIVGSSVGASVAAGTATMMLTAGTVGATSTLVAPR